MTKMTCVLGRHEWRPGVDLDDQPYEKCETCGRYRYPGSGSGSGRFDRHGELPVDPLPGSGLSGGAVGGF